MAANKLLYEIIRGIWCLDVSNIHAYAPILNQVLRGEPVFQGSVKNSAISYYSANGGRVKESELETGFAKVDMIGELTLYGGECTYGALDYVHQLDQANNNPRIQGIVFHVDGPGGSVGAINPFTQFKARKKKPVIGLVNSACSAHLWSLLEVCDYVIAQDAISGRFGSVGVMCTFADVRGAYKEKGIELHEIYADESEHKNEAFRLALEGKYDMIKQEELSPIAIKFQNAVKAARPTLIQEPGVLTGKTYFAEDAKRLGLIDAIGTIEDAFAMIEVLNQVKYKSK